MACSKQLPKLGKDGPSSQEGEPEFRFQVPKLHKGQCIQAAAQNEQLKHLVRLIKDIRSSRNPRASTATATATVATPEAHSLVLPSSPEQGPSFMAAVRSPNDRSSSSRHRSCLSSISSTFSFSSTSIGSSGIGSSGSGSNPETAGPRGPPSESSSQEGPSGGSLDLQSSAANESGKEEVFAVTDDDLDCDWVPEVYSVTEVRDSDATLQMAANTEQLQDCPITSSMGADEGDMDKGSSISCDTVMQQPRKRKRERKSKNVHRVGRPRTDHKEEYMRRLGDVQIQLPRALKPLLLEDWELVTFGKKLFTLPAKKTVADILAEYVDSQKNYAENLTISEVMSSLQEYFDNMLSNQLLYNFEELQHSEILATYPFAPMSHIYGGAHLLRLFSQICPMLIYSPVKVESNDSSPDVLQKHLQNFLEYLASDPSRLFSTATDYQKASADYQEKAR